MSAPYKLAEYKEYNPEQQNFEKKTSNITIVYSPQRFPQLGPKNYWEKRRDGILMLATWPSIAWRHMKCSQHSTWPQIQDWCYLDILVVALKTTKGPNHMVEGDHYQKQNSQPSTLNHWNLSNISATQFWQAICNIQPFPQIKSMA